jgi:hypothetical protein
VSDTRRFAACGGCALADEPSEICNCRCGTHEHGFTAWDAVSGRNRHIHSQTYRVPSAKRMLRFGLGPLAAAAAAAADAAAGAALGAGSLETTFGVMLPMMRVRQGHHENLPLYALAKLIARPGKVVVGRLLGREIVFAAVILDGDVDIACCKPGLELARNTTARARLVSLGGCVGHGGAQTCSRDPT